MKKILITGANGILANKLIEKFAKDEGFLTIASTRNIESLQIRYDGVDYINNIDFINGDVLKDVDFLINCAFPRKFEPQILADAITQYNLLVLKAVENKVKNIINISSQDIYGIYREEPSCENSCINPNNNYALTKYACEKIGDSIAYNSDTKLVNIRLASLIGKEYPERVINKIVERACNTNEIAINNDKNVFGYLDVEDAVDGLIAFVKNSDPKCWKGVYNLGHEYNQQKDFKYIAQTIKNCFENDGKIISLNITTQEEAEKLCLMNSSEFYKTSNWRPKINLKIAIEKIYRSIV